MNPGNGGSAPGERSINDYNRRRIEMTASCADCRDLPKVSGAGQVFNADTYRFQLMHNGVKVLEDCYYGAWATELIERLNGHHEPQEELVFHRLMPLLRDCPTMVELGSYWAYYSLWFKQRFPRGRCVLVEPDPNNLEVGRRNFAINQFDGTFVHACVGARSADETSFLCESDSRQRLLPQITVDDLLDQQGLDRVDLLLADIQGAELSMLQGAIRSIAQGRIRFALISTHHHTISGDALMHQRCRDFAADRGVILAEHTVQESFSGDGLIAVSFDQNDRDLQAIPISYNRARHSLFGELEYDLDAALRSLAARISSPSSISPPHASSEPPQPSSRAAGPCALVVAARKYIKGCRILPIWRER